MPALKLHYRHNHRYEPHYPSHGDIERVAGEVRRQLGLSDRRALTIADVAAINELNVNGVAYDVWLDLEHQVHDEHNNPVFGVFEFTPTSSVDAVSVCVSPASSGISEELRLSTLAHEMGHAIFDGPALVSHHQNQPLADLMQTGTVRAFRLVTETQAQLQKADNLLPSHIRFAELRANEFMGSLLVPRDYIKIRSAQMILSEFVLTHTKGRSPIDWVYFADVSVTTTTGVLWWKKKHVERRKIARKYVGFWHFVDNGEHCPGFQAEVLERSYKARERLADD